MPTSQNSGTPSRRSALTSVAALAGWLVLVFVAAGIGAIASKDAAAFYATLVLPSWAPPASVFGPVWSVLYLLMGISAWLVGREAGAAQRPAALVLFLAQLAVNALWSWLFFAWRNGAGALADVLILLALIAALIAVFWRIRPLAALLLLPYFAWVCLASALTWTVWQNNPTLLR